MRIGRFQLAQFPPLRAVVALAFVVLSSLQPGLFGNANATGFHGSHGKVFSVQIRDHHASHAGHHHAKAADEQADQHDSNLKDAGCEVHCAPIHGVPAGCSPVLPPSNGCVPEATLMVLQPGEPVELKRPPRT
jgi:hypothetical protein